MDDEIKISVSNPLDDDGFLRRECPTCEQEFKWFNHDEGDQNAQLVDHYYCPRCGEPAGLDRWWTPAQLEFAHRAAGPDLDRFVQDPVPELFSGAKGAQFKGGRDFSLEIPTPDPLIEPNDMVIVEPPCHTNEPLKVPEEATARIHCLVCGMAFAA